MRASSLACNYQCFELVSSRRNELPNSVPIFLLARSSFDNRYRIIAFVCERNNRIETEIDRRRVGAQSIIPPSFVLYHIGRREVIHNGGKLGFANRDNSLRRILGLRLLIVKDRRPSGLVWSRGMGVGNAEDCKMY